MADFKRLGRYEILGVLGKGAMGVVYKGFDPIIERAVALKTIQRDAVDPEIAAQFLLRFKNEARAAGRLTHANIVGVYEYGEDDSVAFIAMEFVEGRGLREYLNRQARFNFAQLAGLMRQLLAGLEFAHRCGVVHRDIKPSNLIVTVDGALKIADFGVARVDMSNLTTVGMVIGTPSYMSPEQCLGKEVDARSDIFSSGVVLYELLTGQKPFAGSVEAIAHKICHEDPVPPSKLSGLKLPTAVDALVATALAKRPGSRFPSARAFSDALWDLAQMNVEVDDGMGTTLVQIGTLMLQKPPPTWDEATLDTAEHELARFLGPMAKVIVRRAAAQTRDRGELCLLLAENLDDVETRRKFVDAFNRNAGLAHPIVAGTSGARSGAHLTHPSQERVSRSGSGRGAVGASAAGAPLESAFVDQVTGQLAVYLGPIARVVTKRAAQGARSRIDFVRRVAENLGTQDRTAFLREVGYPE